jgi:hypothetical protein
MKFKEYIIFEKRRWFPGNLVVDFGWILSGVFAPVFDGHFHGSFSVGHCSGNCLFHWVFWVFGQVFECFVHLALKLPFIQCLPY